jgi:RHS repeat-associated protein
VQIQSQVLAQQEAGAWAYVLPDHLGSVRQLADADGQVSLAQSYDPFGGSFESAGSGASEFGYTGEWWQTEAELLYLRARYYAPGTGRFLSQDTLPGFVSSPQTQHAFVYVSNNPVNRTDPSGHCPSCNPCLTGPCDPGSEKATLWLLDTIRQNADGPMAKLIHFYNWQYELSSGPGGWAGGRILGRKMAYDLWISMVRTGAPWDFKLPIRFRKPGFEWGGEWIKMCCGWYGYENVANIHFGYVGRAAGFTAFELKAGAGVFQWRDHHGEEGYEERISRREVGLHTYYDEPEDQAAIDVGTRLYDWMLPLSPKEFCYRVFNKFAPRLKKRPY